MAHEHPLPEAPSEGAVHRSPRGGRTRWWAIAWLLALAVVASVMVRDPALFARTREILGEAWRRGREFATPSARPARPQVTRIVPVTAVEARRQDLPVFFNGLGSVVAFDTVTIRSRVEGELVRVAFQEGQFVEKGDLLAEIDPRPFEVQLRQAEGQLARDEATLEVARLDLDRYESLAGIKQITGQQIDAQRALVRQGEAAIQIDRGVIDNVRLQLQYCAITAPISGRIGLRLVDSGNIVRANDPAGLAVVAQVRPIAVVFTIPQDDIVRVQRALAASGRLPVEAYNRDFRTRLATGSLLAIDNQVDTATGTVRLKAVFPNDDDALFPNQFVNTRLLVETLTDATVVPAAAVQRGPQSTFVYVVTPDSKVALRPVQAGPAEGDLVTIAVGLDPGEFVVTDGIDKISDGAQVAVRDTAPASLATGTAPGGPAAAARP